LRQPSPPKKERSPEPVILVN
jgi:hypothetical protein